MQQVLVDIEHHAFELDSCPLHIDSRLSALFNIAPTGRFPAHMDSIATTSFLTGDYWIPRGSSLRIEFEFCLAPDLKSQSGDLLQLNRVLRQSIVSAELWKQLDFRASIVASPHENGNPEHRYRFTILLLDLRRSTDDNVRFYPFHQDQDLSNLKPPMLVPCWQIKTAQISIKFTTVIDNLTTQSIVKKSKRKSIDCLSFVQLIDASLRRFLCHKPSRMFGLKQISQRRDHSLSMMAPSIFIPEYADSLYSRCNLIDSISGFLLAYTQRNPIQAGVHDTSAKNPRFASTQRGRIRSDLWITMANALKIQRSANKLKPIKMENFDSTRTPEAEFEDIIYGDHQLKRHGTMIMLDEGGKRVCLQVEPFRQADEGDFSALYPDNEPFTTHEPGLDGGQSYHNGMTSIEPMLSDDSIYDRSGSYIMKHDISLQATSCANSWRSIICSQPAYSSCGQTKIPPNVDDDILETALQYKPMNSSVTHLNVDPGDFTLDAMIDEAYEDNIVYNFDTNYNVAGATEPTFVDDGSAAGDMVFRDWNGEAYWKFTDFLEMLV